MLSVSFIEFLSILNEDDDVKITVLQKESDWFGESNKHFSRFSVASL